MRPRWPHTVPGKRLALQTAMALFVLVSLPSAWVYATTGGQMRTVETAPDAPVAIVFGAGVYRSGEPGRWLADRLDAGAELYHSGRVDAILVTGDNSRENYNEPDSMRAYLVREHGVPADRVVTDYAGFSTWDSCFRAASVFGVDRALLVSQQFHVPRAMASCEAVGIEVWGVGVPGRMNGLWVSNGLREMAGSVTAAWNAVFTPDPAFPGPPDDSLEETLRAVRDQQADR